MLFEYRNNNIEAILNFCKDFAYVFKASVIHNNKTFYNISIKNIEEFY